MPLNRRGFLKILAASVAAGTLFSNETQALLAQAPQEFNKFAEVVNKCRVIIDINNAWRDRPVGSRDAINSPVNDLLNFLADNFDAPPATDTEGFDELLRTSDQWFGKNVDCLDEQSLRRVVECVVPVSVMRSLLVTYRVCFYPSKMAGWTVFSDRYHDLILAV